MIGLFFKFNRFWSVRNLDLVTLILIAPGLLLVQYGIEVRQSEHVEFSAVTAALEGTAEPLQGEILRAVNAERFGYCWCFAVGGFWLLRLLLDPTMVRRPLLEPNLTTGGLAFIGCSLYLFLMANVVANKMDAFSGLESSSSDSDLEVAAAESRDSAADIGESDAVVSPGAETPVPASKVGSVHGPGYAMLRLVVRNMAEGNRPMFVAAAKAVTIIAHFAVVLGLVLIGYRQFDNIRTGIGVATLYLMMPHMAITAARVDHVLPAALLVWALLGYRRPVWAGVFLGLAAGIVYYPFFLLPLWASFYWRRGLGRFTISFVSMLVILVVAQFFVARGNWDTFGDSVVEMFGLWLPRYERLEGIWGLGWRAVYRLPILALFVAMSATLAIWPAQKNLGTLISCSAAVILGTQFWHGYGGGIFVGWYLPLLLLTIFRPNLEDRIAVSVLGESWWFKRFTRDGWLAQPRRRADQGERDGQSTRRRDNRRKSNTGEIR